MSAPGPAANGTPILTIALLGPLRVEAGAHPLRLRSRKALATIGYLALAPAAQETRERLAALLWSESEEDKARASLRQVVHELAEALQQAGIGALLRAGRLTLGLDAARLAQDLAPVLAETEAGRVHPRLLDTPGLPQRLLEGLEDLDPCFRDWVLARRQALHDRLLQRLELRLPDVAGGPEPRDMTAAPPRDMVGAPPRDVAQAILGLDPTHEPACRALMAAAAAAGDAAAALEAHARLRRLLEADYATAPGAATEALATAIATGSIAGSDVAASAGRGDGTATASPANPDPAPVPPGSDNAPRPAGGAPEPAMPPAAILIEPFGLNGVPPGRAHLVQGLRQALADALVRLGAGVVAEGLPTHDPADPRLAAAHRLSATAYQAGDRISLMVTLAPAAAGAPAWSERLDLGLEGWIAARRRLLGRIAETLGLPLSAARLRRLTGPPETLRAGLDPWLRARSATRTGQWESALALLREAAAAAPEFAPAQAGLARLLGFAHLLRPGLPRSAARDAAGLRHARRAVALDPADADAQLGLGWALALAGRHGPAALPMRLAQELAPEDGATLLSLALFHACCGEHAVAAELGGRARALTPAPAAPHWAGLAAIAFLGGEEETALRCAMPVGEALPALLALRAAALARLGRRAEARALAERFLLAVRADWHGAGGARPAATAHWLLAAFPLRQAADWARLRDGLALAGLAAPGAAHGRWYG